MPMFGRIGRPGLIGLAARTAVVAGTATAVSGGMARRAQRRAQEQAENQAYEAEQQQEQMNEAAAAAARTAPVATSSGSNLIDELQKLSALHAQGGLSDEEYTAAKAKLLQ